MNYYCMHCEYISTINFIPTEHELKKYEKLLWFKHLFPKKVTLEFLDTIQSNNQLKLLNTSQSWYHTILI